MKLLLTGATGFLGRRLVPELLRHGHDVRALARDPAKAPPGVEAVRGDVTDRASVEAAMAGVEGVLHLAAIYDFGVDRARMAAVNVEGTRNVLDAAGGRRVLYCGSDTSLGDTKGGVRDETARHDGAFRSAYEETKHAAHALVSERIAAGAPIVHAIVSTVYGPGDASPVGEMIEHHLAGRAVACLDRNAGCTFAHVDDVARGLRLAFERGRPGETYLLSGTPATFGAFFEALSSRTGIAPPAFELPRPLTFLLRLLGKSAAQVRELAAMGRGVTRFFSGARARTELGWEPRPLGQGLEDSLPWYRERENRASAAALRRTRPLLLGLLVFDLLLGGAAAFFPDLYLGFMHPRSGGGGLHWLTRTGFLWLFFALAEGLAAWRLRPELVLVVGALRIMDVPADLAYLASARDLGTFGTLALVFSPVFNAVAGAWLALRGLRRLRAASIPRTFASSPR